MINPNCIIQAGNVFGFTILYDLVVLLPNFIIFFLCNKAETFSFPPCLLRMPTCFSFLPGFPLGVFPLPLLTPEKRLYLREQDTETQRMF